jgi:hypothetical protein
MRRNALIVLTVTVVLAVGIGAYFYGRDHPAKVQAAAATTTTTTKPMSIAQTPCGTNSDCLTLTDKAGDAITVTLDGEVQAPSCNVAEHGAGSYVVILRFDNTGTTILNTDQNSYRDALTLIDTSSTAYNTDYGGSCGYQNAQVASGLSECKNSAYNLDLAPGSAAVWCPLITFPTTSTLTSIQFNATDFFSPAFSQTGINNAVTWSVGGSGQ